MDVNQNSKEIFNEFESSRFDNEPKAKDFRDYLNILKANIIPMLLIFVIVMSATLIYIFTATSIYKATTTIKIENQQNNILESPLSDVAEFRNDRYILNQMEVLKSYYIRDNVANQLLDSAKNITDKAKYKYIFDFSNESNPKILKLETLRRRLLSLVSINQKKGLDAIEISVEGESFDEAQLISNTYADVFVRYTRDLSRQDITNVKNFLDSEKEKKFNELNAAETNLEDYQKKSGLILLDEQARTLINTIAQYEADKNTAEIEYRANENNLNSLRNELSNKDPQLSNYVQGQISSSYIEELQRQIADLEVQRDIQLGTASDVKVRDKIIADADKRLALLRANLSEKVNTLRTGLVSETPEEIRTLTQKVLDASLLSQAYRSRANSLTKVLGTYENEFSRLPSESIELAKLSRNRASAEKLYLTLEEKYQEAQINERARLGNASILDPGYDNFGPIKPKKTVILTAGFFLGLGLGIAFAFIRAALDKTIKTPDEIEDKGITILSWIPSILALKDKHDPKSDFIVYNNPTSSIAEAFKALRTRVQFSKVDKRAGLKTILVTSSLPSEGKTVVSVNLAGSFAQFGKKVLILDCDLRKPRMHTVFGVDRFQGITDYLFSNAKLEEIIKTSKQSNLSFITSGTIPPNPSELLGSVQMKNFLELLKDKFDVIIIDSPPFLAVTDAEILFNITDGAILVAQADQTPMDAFIKVYDRLNRINPHNILGSVLNNFRFKSSYGTYYNYYYSYGVDESLTDKTQK